MSCDTHTKEPATLAELTVKILLQAPVSSPTENDLHEIDPRDEAYWESRGGRRCAVKNNPGRETLVAAQLSSASTFRVILRYDSLTKLIDSSWRIKRPRAGLTADVWQVDSAVNWNEVNRWVLLKCVRVE